MATDNKRKLYDALSQDYDMGSYEQFCNDLNDDAKRRKLYDATSQEYDLGTWDSFSQQLGYGQGAAPAPERPAAPSAPVDTLATPTPPPATPTSARYFKLRRGGKDFTVSTDEVNAAGGLAGWAAANPGAPLRVYMQGKKDDGTDFDGHVDLSVAHDRSKRRGYKYTTTSQAIEDKPWQPTEQEKIAMSRQLHQMQARTDAAFAETRERMENVSEYYRGNRGLGFHTVEGKPVFNPETGKVEKTYLTPTGDRTTSKTDADMATFQFRQAMAAADMSVGAQMRRAEAELAQLRKQYEESKSRVHGEWADDYEKNDAPLAAVLAANTYVPRQTSDKNNSALRVAIRQKEEQLKNLQEERDRQIGKDVGFWRGFGRVVSDSRTWDFGTGDLLDAMTMLNADKYSAPDATEEEKRAGQEMLKAISDNQQVEEMYGGNASFWNRAGVMTGYMPSFMLDFALTGGGYEAINVAGKAAARGSVKLIGEAAIKEMTELGVKAYAKKYGLRGVGRMAENWTIKALGTTADDLLIRAPLMTNTVQAGKTAADIIDRKLGDVQVDSNGNYNFANDRTWGSAVWQGEANAIIENYSEMFGTHLDGVVPALAKTFGGKRVSGMLARANASSYGQILATTRKQFERLGVSDYFGEVSEEYYGQLWRTMLNLDDAYQQNPDGTRTNLLFTGQFHGDIWGGMALSMGLMGAGKYTLSGAAYGAMKHQVNKADRAAAEIFTPERWEPIREIIDNTTNDDMGALAESMVNDSNLSDEERAAVMGYMERSLNLRGLNLGAMAQSRGAEDEEAVGLPMPVEIDSELSQSYIDGYEASTPQEMNDAQNMYEYQRQRVEGMFEPSMLDLLDTNPVDALMDIARNGLYSQEEIDAARDYVNAKTVRDGILQRVHDNIDEQIAQSDAMINARVNPASGMIQPAIMGLDDRQVYVVGGSLAINPDGTIDREASDESVVVRDAQTGELQFTDPKSIVSAGEAIDPEVEKAIAVDNIRQQAAQAAADAMNGTLAFNPGDVVEINDGGGLIQVTVLGPLVDEESGMPIEGQVMVQFPNGQQTAFAKEQLQSFADAANLERLNNFEQERAAARTQQQATEAEAMRPQFALNDEFTIHNDNGTPIRGSITAELDEDGTVEIHTEEPINGNHVNRFTPAELEEMFDTYNGQPLTIPVPNIEETVPNIEENPNIAEQNSENLAEVVPNPEETVETEPQASVLARVPVDEQGQPKYEEADPDTAWDAIVEQAQGDEATAAEVVADIVSERQDDFNAAEKALNKTKEGKPEKRKKNDPAPTMAERIAAKNAAKEALAEAQAIRDRAKAILDHWKKIAGTKQRREAERRNAEDAEARRRAEERAAEEARLRAEREEADRIEREALNGVPDWSVDTPQDARARGYRRNGPQKVDRPEIIDNHAIGNSVEVKFGDDVMQRGNVVVIDASQLQPSHRDGQRNPAHFLDEAQPKERKDAASRFAAAKIAEGIRPEEITSSVTAYTGAPSINARGEVIQGNNRSEALRLMYSNHAEAAQRYKQYLIDHAAEFGLTPEAIEAFEQPVLANMLDVSDENAITLGQYVAQDTESGGIERIKPKNAVQKMGDKMRTFANLLLRSADDEATFAQLVDANGINVLKWMNQQGYITNTQYASAFDSKGNLTAEAANDLKGIMYQSIFTGGSTRLEEMFNKMPAKAQRAILATAFRDYDSAFADRMISEIQQSIIAFDALMGYEQFRDATSAEATQHAVEAWKLQFAFDDVSGEPYLPSETFSNFALALAAMYKGNTQKHIQSVFNMMYDIVQGTEQDNLFEAADKTPKPLAEAIRRVLNLEYQPITKPTTDNGTNGSAVLDINSEDGQDGRPGSDGNADGAEQHQEEAEPADGGTGTASDSGQWGEAGTSSNSVDIANALFDERGSLIDAVGLTKLGLSAEQQSKLRGIAAKRTKGWEFDSTGRTSTIRIGGQNGFELTQDEMRELAKLNAKYNAGMITRGELSEAHTALGNRVAARIADEILNSSQETERHNSAALAENKSVKPILYDNQGNPIDENGNLIIENVKSIVDISDADFTEPTRTVGLPALPEIVQQVLSTNGKRVIIKKNIFERNALRHDELTPDMSRAILNEALYNPTLYGKNKPLSRPNNWIVINVPDGKGNNKLVVLEVNENKDNVEIVHWHEADKRGLEKIKRQAEREDGQLLILPSETSEEAGALSGPTFDSPSDGKVSDSAADKQADGGESSYTAEQLEAKSLDELGLLIADAEHAITDSYDNQIDALIAEKENLEGKWNRTSAEGRRLKQIDSEIADLEKRKKEEALAASKHFREVYSKKIKENATPLSELIAEAEAEVNTNPTPAQKAAGNYKKGHVQVGTFDVTIEQPVGSVRRGTDADGKEWETTMQNTYGYIRGTEGLDGDHIDVFLSTDIDAWNGRRVVIVDQYNPDGTFDEHKVMLGFNDKADAINAYLANYEKGWEKGRRLVFSTATLEDFEKWIESSHRKQKPYHEYKIAEKAEVEESTPENPVSETEYERDPLFDEVRQWLGMKGLAADDSSRNAVMRCFKIGYVRAGNILNAIAEANAQQSNSTQEVEHTEPTSDYSIDTYTTKKGKTYHRVVFPRADKAVWQERLNLAKKMGGTSVPMGYGFKTKEEAEAFAKAVADPTAVADAQPLSLDDVRPSSGIAQVDVEGLLTQLSETGEANLADLSTPVEATPDNKGEEKPVNPSGNKLVTDERYAELRERMRRKLGGQVNMGVDPEILAIGTEMAVYHIEKGARKFKAYASAMIADLGDAIRPYLKSFYNAVRDMPEAEAAGLVSDMDSYDEVRSVDIANFDKPGTDAMATAAAVVAEQQAETEQAEAARKLQAYRHLVNKYAQDIANHSLFKKAVRLMDSKNIEVISRELYDYYVGNDIESIATNELYKMFVGQWNIDNGVLLSAITAEAIRKAHKTIRDEQTTVNPDGTTTQTVVESGTQIEITSGDFIPGVRPSVETEKKPGGKKKPGKTKPKPTTDGGLFDAAEDDATTAPAISVPEQRPADDLIGDSAAYQEREAQIVELVEEIGSTIENRVEMLQLDPESVKPLTMTDVKKMVSKYPALKDISDTDLQELVELAMTQLTRSEALVNINGTAEQQRSAYDHIVNLYQIQPSLNARDSERLIKQQYSTPTPFGFVMGQFVRAGGKEVGSMLEPSAGNGALTITVHPSVIHVNDIDDARLANLRKLGYGQVTAQDALLPFSGDKVDVVMTNPPFGTVTEKVYDGVFRISSLEGQMAINALEQMKDDGRAAIVIGGNTSYRTNGSMNPKDAAFFGYLYSHYNVADVINISGKALYSRNGTGYDVRMILLDGRKTGEFQRVYPPVKAKARAEQITTFDELYKRVQDDIQQIQQVGNQSADVQRDPETAADGTASAPVRSGNNRPDTGAGQRPGTTSDAVRDTPRTDSGQPTPGNVGSRPSGVDNADTGNAGSTDNVPQSKPEQPRSVGDGSTQNGTGRSGSDGRGTVASRLDRGAERLEVKPDLTTEKVPYPNQSDNGFTLMSVVPAAQAQVLQKSLGEIGDVDQYLVDELGYSSKEELYSYLAAEQIDSVALAIHQMDKGNAFIIGDMTGVGKGRQGAALIRYSVKQGKVPIYLTQKPTLYTDNYRDLCDIGSSDLRPFIIASNPKDANIVDADGNVVHKLPSKKEQERVFNYIMEHGTLPDEYDYVLTTYDQIKNGTADYEQNEDGTWNTVARKLPKKSKGYTTADANGQTRRDALARFAEGNITILDESHTVGGDSGCGRYMQMLTSQAGGVTFLSATFAKRADNMPIYAQRTAIAEAGVKASELIDAIMKGGVTLQEIMSKQLVESGQMIRRERSFEGVTIDWLSVAEETDRRQRQQFNEVAEIFNAIRNFQDDYITPIIDAKNEEAAEHGATVGHTQGTKDMGVKNVPFASKMYNLVNQLLFALKVDAVADRVVENLRNGYKPVISFTNTMEGFLSSAPKGVAMDDVPNFSLTLMRALDGVMRFTEKDADENSEGGSISLSELSTEGQNAYNAIREKIMNLSADLPISPMDAIRMKIEDAGYSVAEITGRTMQLNRTDDGRYIVEARKDRDKKAAMRDFNSGKLDVLMINKSGSTGISLHASSKFEDQRPRVMVFAQFQSDINDEVQMRGRIDRSGQVTRGRYEYIMSTIPAEQRIQMMFKAKLKSLDANTTSSQKSKFNEMEIVDYLNKYGDEVVWEYMKEHPELEERLGDPLDMLQEKKDDDGPRTSEKEDTSKKTGCAGKISRYLAFLSVEEQDEIFREITEAYRVKIQLLDDAGENDLEITTMPLRAETKRKQIWHEGENPGSGNAFADNTYVEEVEVDVLKKPMKRAEIEEATRKLVGEKGLATEYDQQRYGFKEGEVNWNRYVETMQSEIDQFFQTKADEAVAKLKEAGDARVAKAREKAVSAATKARSRGENNFSDEEIQSLADTVANEAREKETYKQRKRREEIMAVRDRIKSLFTNLRAGGIYVVPQDLKQATPEMFSQTFGTFVGFKFNKSYTLGSSTAIFATLDGRRKVELALSDPGLQTIIGATNIAYRYSPKEINAINMENWDSKVPTQTRQKRYIITGNLLQALVDTEKGEKTRGNLISYSTIDGETRQGILMGENFKLTDLRNSAPLSSRLAQIREGKAIVSENGDVQIERELYDWRHRGEYELRVPKSKQRGGIYTMHPDLLKLVSGHNFITKGNNMVAYVAEADIAKVVDMLSRAPFNLTVLQESKLADVSADEAEDDVLCRPVTDKATLDRLNSEPTIKVYRAMQIIDGGLRPPMSARVDGELREATEVGVWEEAEEHPEMADEKGRFKLDKGNGKSIKAAYNPYIHTSRSPINDQFSSAWSRPELVTVEVEVPASELTSEYHAEKAKDSVGEKEWKSGPVGRALAKIGQARKVILSRWSRIVRVVPVEEVAEAYAQRLNAHGIEVPFNTVPPALRDALVERGVKIGKPEKGNAGNASMPAFEQWIAEQERQRMGDGYGAYSDAEVSYANDPISKVMGKNRFSKKRQAEFAARERQRMVTRIQELAERMHLDNVEINTDASQLEGKRAKAKGFYNKRTRKITIVIPNNVSTIDAEQTLLHEAVAHYGLRQLFGEQFNTFLDNVYQSADESIRRKIAEMAAQNGWDFRTATEEYLAGLAEDTNFGEAQSYTGWWSEIKRLFLDMLENIGFEGFRDKVGVVLTDNELRYILWRSYENLAEPGRYRSILGEAADVAKQSELKVGNYAEGGIEAEYAAEPSNIEVMEDRFDHEIAQYEAGLLPQTHRFELGMPSRYLKSAGFPNLPISMRSSLLATKASMNRHPFSASDLKGLVSAMQKPIAIFEYSKANMRNLIVDVKRGDKHFLVGVTLNYKAGDIEVNSVSGLFPKDSIEWLKWLQDGKAIRIDQKEKVQQIIDSQRTTNTVESERIGLNLEDVAKVVKNFENPTIEEEELFRSGDFSPRDRVLARNAYESVVRSGGYQFKEAVQDSMLGLKELYKAISDGTESPGHKQNFRIEDVPGFENAYLFENRMSSMNAGEQHEYFQRYMQPLLKEIGRIAGANERKRRELTDYIMAKHGLERNEYMRNEAVANGEDTNRDFAGLMGLTGEADWQSAEDTARQWVDDYEAGHDTTALWATINAATKATLEKVYLSGLISKETYEKILGMYDYYVPLRGWDEKTSDEVYGYLTSTEGPLGGGIMKRAEGRESKADDPIATIGMMADAAIRQGNRNLMKQRFLNFILNHPSDAVSVHDLWFGYNDVTNEWVPVFADVEETDTADVVEQKVEAFEQRMEALRRAEPDKYKKGREAQHIPYKVVRGNLREHQILIKRNGRTFVATINGNPRAAQAINGLTNPDVDQNGVVGNMLKAVTWVNRQLSAFYTTRNPDFVVGNFFRDMLYSNCMTWVKESPRYARRFHKNFARVNPLVMRRLLGKWEKGTLNMSNRIESLFYQFMKNGGETGYTNVRDIEGHKRAVAAELKKQGSTGRRVWTALGMQLDLLNRAAENCARFAAFVTSRDFGRNIDRAIYDAKEISVNFNKKGSGGKMVNATGQTKLGKAGAYLSGGGRLLYVFWNAGIQGMTNFGRQAKLHPGKFTVGATALFTLGYVIPMLAQMLGGGDGDDDKNAYYNLPEYVRRSNICFFAGDQWITIPLPIEYRALYGMGELAHGVISGNERYSDSELARQMASQVSQIMPLDMLEGGGGISPFIPSAGKPFTEAYIMNKGWTGLPVYKDTPFNKNDPEWTKAYASADKHLVAFAKWLNETSGGDDFKKGSIDINPAKIEYLLNGTFGGLFTFPNKIKKSGETMFGDREFEWRNMPIANRLIKSGDERTANRKLQNEYFKYLKEYEATGQLMRKYENADEDGIMGYAERINFLENSPEYARWEIFDEFKADIDAYSEDIAAETDKEERKRIEAEMYGVMRELVNALHDPEAYRNSEQE